MAPKVNGEARAKDLWKRNGRKPIWSRAHKADREAYLAGTQGIPHRKQSASERLWYQRGFDDARKDQPATAVKPLSAEKLRTVNPFDVTNEPSRLLPDEPRLVSAGFGLDGVQRYDFILGGRRLNVEGGFVFEVGKLLLRVVREAMTLKHPVRSRDIRVVAVALAEGGGFALDIDGVRAPVRVRVREDADKLVAFIRELLEGTPVGLTVPFVEHVAAVDTARKQVLAELEKAKALHGRQLAEASDKNRAIALEVENRTREAEREKTVAMLIREGQKHDAVAVRATSDPATRERARALSVAFHDAALMVKAGDHGNGSKGTALANAERMAKSELANKACARHSEVERLWQALDPAERSARIDRHLLARA